ncbi:hypothetical protein M0811_01553 [Anaeramoeba ignava]|uniref:Uncharacterized protein n=1 Tax=Anaeramoeba ignava TaxID=1746090 RepID=A0A9Q0RAJ0_ANAIG|nr:hypothetical protein M0811_01553 [Anaeramoeba ignava]
METIQIVEIISQIADFELELYEFDQLKDELLFSSFNFELWDILIKWFFDKKNNNIYHNLFYRIFDAAVKLENEESLEIILFKADFVTKLITMYQEQMKSNKHCLISGFVILFCNVLRLKSQMLPKYHYLPKFLNNLQIWKDFEETLNIQTSRQLPNTSRMIAKPHFSSKLFENKEINYHIPGHGLGSGYAQGLGFFDK